MSWYEARAYAAFAGKRVFLPSRNGTGRHLPTSWSYVVRESNISRAELSPVGAYQGLGPFGTYDMAGNVREWIVNAADADRRFILGGAARNRSPTSTQIPTPSHRLTVRLRTAFAA